MSQFGGGVEANRNPLEGCGARCSGAYLAHPAARGQPGTIACAGSRARPGDVRSVERNGLICRRVSVASSCIRVMNRPQRCFRLVEHSFELDRRCAGGALCLPGSQFGSDGDLVGHDPSLTHTSFGPRATGWGLAAPSSPICSAVAGVGLGVLSGTCDWVSSVSAGSLTAVRKRAVLLGLAVLSPGRGLLGAAIAAIWPLRNGFGVVSVTLLYNLLRDVAPSSGRSGAVAGFFCFPQPCSLHQLLGLGAVGFRLLQRIPHCGAHQFTPASLAVRMPRVRSGESAERRHMWCPFRQQTPATGSDWPPPNSNTNTPHPSLPFANSTRQISRDEESQHRNELGEADEIGGAGAGLR